MTALEHVLWIGGPSASGKTTAARRLARRHGLRWYSADAHTWEHRDVAIAQGHEGALRWEAMSFEERAAAADDPEEAARLNLDFDRGPMLVGDLRRLPPAPLVVADGSIAMPELVAQGHAAHDRSVWLLPTLDTHRAFHEQRGMPHLAGYRWFVKEEIERQAAEHGVNVLRIDDTTGVDAALAELEALFADALAQGPCAESAEERRALLRYANEATVEQARGYLARPWSSGDEATFEREFLCECDDPECGELVRLAVADYAPGVVAHA